jgi:hypothetical protein
MGETSAYFDAIDNFRLRRAREMSAVKHSFTTDQRSDPFSIRSKSVVVLTYAHWEGFYNECASSYIDFLSASSIRVSDASWNLLVGVLSGEFNALINRNHSADARRVFVEKLKNKISCNFDEFDRSTVLSRSNLDFETLRDNFILLNLDVSKFQRHRIRMNKELVGWRHAVAHGSPPDLANVDVEGHVDFTSDLMLKVADTFQEAICGHI